jgi:hypothetical protein
MTSFPRFGFALAIGAMAFVAVPRASATAELFLSDGAGHTATVVASSCGGSCATATFNGGLGDWNINVTTGTANPGEEPIMDLNSIDHHNSSGVATTLTIAWTNDTFVPVGSFPQGFQLNDGGTVSAGGTVTATLYGGLGDSLFDTSNKIGTTLSFSNPPIAFSGTENAYLSSLSPNPFSLTEVATITFGKAAGQASFDYSVDSIPEPAGVLLLGTVMLFTVSFIRRKRVAGSKRA